MIVVIDEAHKMSEAELRKLLRLKKYKATLQRVGCSTIWAA